MINVDICNVGTVGVGYSRLSIHPDLKCEMATLDLRFGDDSVSLRFNSCAAMIEFCKAHNFPYRDDRGVLE